MKILFATTQTLRGSTVLGRILPLAQELKKQHEIHLLVLEDKEVQTPADIHIRHVGQEPFTRTPHGKIRLSGLSLIWHQITAICRTAGTIWEIRPDVIVIVKPLPANTFGVWLGNLFHTPKKIILDVDDFELTANHLSSIWQRAVVHASERTGASLANAITVASPFLEDHMRQLAQTTPVILLPTGLSLSVTNLQSEPQPRLAYIGSISTGSGHMVDMLPEILQTLHPAYPSLRLHMVGDGDDVEKLKGEFQNKGVAEQVVWHGRFSPATVTKHLTAHTILIDPINDAVVNRAKSSSRTTLALALSLPIVTSNIGIRSLMIPEDMHKRFFAAPGNAKEYSQRIEQILKQPLNSQEQDLLKTSSRRYTWDVLSKEFLNLL